MAGPKVPGCRTGRFNAEQSGTTAIVFTLAIVPVLLATGVAVDELRCAAARSELQAALDSGALAVASAGHLADAARVKSGEDNFARSLAASDLAGRPVSLQFMVNGSSVSAEASLALPLAFPQLAGLPDTQVHAETEIPLPNE